MNHLTRSDYAAALRLLAALESEAENPERFARACIAAVTNFVAGSARFARGSQAAAGESAAETSAGRSEGAPEGTSTAVSAEGRSHRAELVLAAQEGGPARLVLERKMPAFSERDRERLKLLEPHLAYLYRQACGVPVHLDVMDETHLLTSREREVMRWVSCGKTDADVAALLGISPRTVHKHLEHIYVKLGVETRTAAVMRAHRLA